jgi:hypothetical protein
MKIPAFVSRQGRQFGAEREAASLSEAVELIHRQAIESVCIIGSKASDSPGLISLQELTKGIVRDRLARFACLGPIAGGSSQLTVR